MPTNSDESILEDEKLARLLQQQFDAQDSGENFDNMDDFLRRERTCDICKRECTDSCSSAASSASDKVHPLLNCDHRLCSKCALEIVNIRKPSKQTEYVCPIQNCLSRIAEADIRAILPASEVDRYVDLGLKEAMSLQYFSR